jgi:hypothetical protein
VPLRLVELPGRQARYGADLVLVRPDQHVPWRGTGTPPAAEVLDRILGVTCESGRRPAGPAVATQD